MEFTQTATKDICVSRRRAYLLLVPIVLFWGLAIRAAPKSFSPLFAEYAPDVLWAVLVFSSARLLMPRLPITKVTFIALSYCFLMECSQLYQASWINDLRATRIGGLMLGYVFLWSDLVCYSVGVTAGAAFDRVLLLMSARRGEKRDERKKDQASDHSYGPFRGKRNS